jgi:hypothetical protein
MNHFFIYSRTEYSRWIGVDLIRKEPVHPRAQRKELNRFAKANKMKRK